MRLKTVVALLAALIVSAVAGAQPRPLTLDDLYDPASRANFSGNPPPSVHWVDPTHFTWLRPGPNQAEWQLVDAAGGSTRPLFDAARMTARLTSDAELSDADARAIARS